MILPGAKIGACAVFAGCCFLATVAASADWRVTGSLSQNMSVRNESSDGVSDTSVQGSTGIGVAIRAQTPRTEWRLSPSLRLFERIGGGSDRDPLEVSGSVTGAARYTAPRLGLNGLLSVTPEFASDNDFTLFLEPDPDTGELRQTTSSRERDALQITSRAVLGATYAVDPLSSVSLSTTYRRRDYLDDIETLDPFWSLGATLGFNQALTPRVGGGLSFGVQRFESEDPTSADTTTLTLGGNLSARLTPRHSGGLSLNINGSDDGDSTDISLGGSASLSYQLENMNFNVSAQQSVEQNDDGEIVNLTGLRAGGGYRINETSRISLSTGLTFENPLFGGSGDDVATFVLSPRYELSLTQDWRLSVGYGFRATTDDEVDNRIFLSLTRSLTLLD